LKTLLLFCCTAFFVILGISDASATTYTWAGGSSGSWGVAANWSPSTGYPGQSGTTDIAIVNTTNATIGLTGNYTIAQLKSTSFGVSGVTVNLNGSSSTLAINSGLNFAQPSSLSIVLTFNGTGTATIGGTSTFAYHGSFYIASGATVNFTSGSIIDWTNTQAVLSNYGTMNLTSCTVNMGSSTTFDSPGTTNATSTTFNLSSTPSILTYSGKFVATSCTFNVSSSCYIKSTSTSSTFAGYGSTFNLSGSGGAAYFYNAGTFWDHKSTYNLTGQSAYIQNSGASATMHFRGSDINFTGGSNNQYINNSGTFYADSATTIDASTFTSYITNSGTFYAGTSGSACTITLSGQAANVSSTGTFYLGSTSIIYPTGFAAYVTNTSPGTFTLQSDASGSAAIGALSSTATCNGNFNVERFFQGGATKSGTRWVYRNYRILSSPVNTGTLVNLNRVSGLTYIVGATAGLTTTANSTTNAFVMGATGGSSSSGNPSLFLYRESITPSNLSYTSGNFIGITNITSASAMHTSDGATNTTIPVGNGFFFFFRGNASSFSTRTSSPFLAPENVTLTSTGNLNQQSVTVKNWYTPLSSNLGYTGSGTGTNYAVRGFNAVGNPYACSIDWNTAYSGTGITRTNVNPTIWMFNPFTNQYDTYITTSSSTGTSNGGGTDGSGFASKIIASGQGFFVQASAAGASLVFNEAAKSATSQLTGSSLFMGAPPANDVAQLLRLRMVQDSLNYDDITIVFNSAASPTYNGNEDAQYLPGINAAEGLASLSNDSLPVPLSINSLPLPKKMAQVIGLTVTAQQSGAFTFRRTELDAIPQIYEVWLMDKYKKDSLDLRHNATYAFNIDLNDAASFGSNRFSIVIRQNPVLGVRLLNFTAAKAPGGAQIVWKTENEQNYTNFTVERSIDNGQTFTILGGLVANGSGTYSLLDKSPDLNDQYRLKIEDLNGTITYSAVVTLGYSSNSVVNNMNVYPNPATNSINLNIKPTNSLPSNLSALQVLGSTPSLVRSQNISTQSYNIKIISITGTVIKTALSSLPDWHDNVSTLTPGTYIIQVTNASDNSVVGKSTFVKL